MSWKQKGWYSSGALLALPVVEEDDDRGRCDANRGQMRSARALS